MVKFLLVLFSSPPRSFRMAALPSINWSSQFGLVCELDTKALHGLFQMMDKDINRTDPRSDPCRMCILTSLLVERILLTAMLSA